MKGSPPAVEICEAGRVRVGPNDAEVVSSGVGDAFGQVDLPPSTNESTKRVPVARRAAGGSATYLDMAGRSAGGARRLAARHQLAIDGDLTNQCASS